MESADTVAIATWKGTERGRLIGDGDGDGDRDGEGEGGGDGDRDRDGEGDGEGEGEGEGEGDGEREGKVVVNKMGVWFVIRIWEGGIDFSHFSF